MVLEIAFSNLGLQRLGLNPLRFQPQAFWLSVAVVAVEAISTVAVVVPEVLFGFLRTT
jgi:hypothetical protein